MRCDCWVSTAKLPVFADDNIQKVWNSLHAVSTLTPVSSNGPICLSWMAVFCPHGRSAKADQRKIGFCGTMCVTQTQSQLQMEGSMVTNLIPSDSFHIIFTSSQTGKMSWLNVDSVKLTYLSEPTFTAANTLLLFKVLCYSANAAVLLTLVFFKTVIYYWYLMLCYNYNSANATLLILFGHWCSSGATSAPR